MSSHISFTDSPSPKRYKLFYHLSVNVTPTGEILISVCWPVYRPVGGAESLDSNEFLNRPNRKWFS